MWNSRLSCIAIAVASQCFGLDLRALSEFSRPDPFGAVVAVDAPGAIWLNSVRLKSARGGYRSFHVVADTRGAANCRLSVDLPLTVDLYREWFHFNSIDRKHYPDALIPVPSPYDLSISAGQNQIPGQVSLAFWVDIWVPAAAEPKVNRGEIRLTCGSGRKVVPLEITVLPAKIPEQDTITLDNNSYGTSWLSDQYPKTLAGLGHSQTAEDALIRLIHDYHRMFYDHRGTYHQLGYGHAGKVGPEFAPMLSGNGRQRHVSDWSLFDRHYGPLFDGTAFKNSRRGPRPIPYVYLPVNPEWPASFLGWGEPGYEAEFENVLSEMERHFRERNWTSTNFELFFNQKKRYKGFNWDGDEIRFARDNSYLKIYHQMLRKAIPADSPVQFSLRADTSWSFEEQSQSLYGVVTMWVVGDGEISWFPDSLARLKAHKDTVWTYGGTPSVQEVSSSITFNPLRSWITGVDGFVRWQTVDPGPDPWFALAGGSETLVYPGERFGVAAPLPSIRLKLQRNCLQDIALLEAAVHSGRRDAIREQVVRRFNRTALSDWRNTRPALASKPVLEWNNTDISEALKPFEGRLSAIQPQSWERVREFSLELQP